MNDGALRSGIGHESGGGTSEGAELNNHVRLKILDDQLHENSLAQGEFKRVPGDDLRARRQNFNAGEDLGDGTLVQQIRSAAEAPIRQRLPQSPCSFRRCEVDPGGLGQRSDFSGQTLEPVGIQRRWATGPSHSCILRHVMR